MMCLPDLFGSVALQLYSPLPSAGFTTVLNGADSRSDHLSGCVTSKPSLVTYCSQVPGCGAQALYFIVIVEPACRVVDGQSERARLYASYLVVGPHRWPSGMISRCLPAAWLMRLPNQSHSGCLPPIATAATHAGFVGLRSPPPLPACPSR